MTFSSIGTTDCSQNKCTATALHEHKARWDAMSHSHHTLHSTSTKGYHNLSYPHNMVPTASHATPFLAIYCS